MSSKAREAEKAKISFPIRGRAGRRLQIYNLPAFIKIATLEREEKNKRGVLR